MATLILLLIVLLALVVGWIVVRRRLDAPDLSRFDQPTHVLVAQAEQISPQHQDVVARLAKYHRDAPPLRDVAGARRLMEELFGREVESRITPVEVAGVPGEWVQAAGASADRRLLFLHGGAFRVGSPKSHRGITDSLSREAGVSVLAIDYRMLPEHRLLDCHRDARTAYRWILEHGPDGAAPAETVFVAGDSAGGNLTLALLAWARDQGLRPANAAVAFAPSTDMTMSSPSWRRNVATDPFLGPGLGTISRLPRALLLLGLVAMGRVRPNDPRVSPLLGDLSGLPPTLLQASEQELLFDDSRRYANKAAAAGSEVTLEVWPTLVHVFQGFAPALPEGVEALASAGRFLRAHARAGARVSDARSA